MPERHAIYSEPEIDGQFGTKDLSPLRPFPSSRHGIRFLGCSQRSFGIGAVLAFCGWLGLMGCIDGPPPPEPLSKEFTVWGTPPCAQRFATGASGTQTMHIFLGDSKAENAVEPGGLLSESSGLTMQSFQVDTTFAPQVIDAEDGSVPTGAQVTLSVVADSTMPLLARTNPRYLTFKKIVGNKRVPTAFGLLVDMSDTSSTQDSSLVRTTGPAAWVLDGLNSNASVGELDLFGVRLMRGDEASTSDELFREWSIEKQFIAEDGRQRGFVFTNQANIKEISHELTVISNSSVAKKPPVYGSVKEMAQDLSAIARSIETKQPKYHPGILLLSTERDVALLDNTKNNQLADAIAVLKGKGWEKESDANFIPLMSVVFPKPENTPLYQWDAYLDDLCKMVDANKTSKLSYGLGQLFQISPRARRDYLIDLRKYMIAAHFALKGYLELKLRYDISGLTSGKRYFVKFKIQTDAGGKKSASAESQELSFEVRMP